MQKSKIIFSFTHTQPLSLAYRPIIAHYCPLCFSHICIFLVSILFFLVSIFEGFILFSVMLTTNAQCILVQTGSEVSRSFCLVRALDHLDHLTGK